MKPAESSFIRPMPAKPVTVGVTSYSARSRAARAAFSPAAPGNWFSAGSGAGKTRVMSGRKLNIDGLPPLWRCLPS